MEVAKPLKSDVFDGKTIGQIFRSERLKLKRPIDVVAKHIRVKQDYLEMIEDDMLDELPARAYAIGFIRAYADYLGLPSNEVVRLSKIQAIGFEFDRVVKPRGSVLLETGMPNHFVVMGSLLACILISWIFDWTSSNQSNIPLVPDGEIIALEEQMQFQFVPPDMRSKPNL